MIRTAEEEKEYLNLPPEDKKRYDIESEMDPTMSHKRIMKAIALANATKKAMDSGKENANPKDPKIIEQILKAAGEWLRTNAESIWKTVKDVLAETISSLGNMIKAGIEMVVESFWDFIFG